MYVDMSIAAGKLDIPCLTSGCGYVMTIEVRNVACVTNIDLGGNRISLMRVL